MNTDRMTASIDAQRRTWETMTEAVKKADVTPERFVDMMATDVGHTDSEVVHTENKLELHYYEPDEKRHETPIFIVYALVNRPYILDLQPDRSVIRRLLENGFEVYLIDWGEPSVLDRSLTLGDYVNRYMDNCATRVCEHAGVDNFHLLGYCMGGTMSIMYTTRFSNRVRTLSLMATPIAFGQDDGLLERWANHYDPDTTVEAMGNLPSELLAVEFSMMDPIDSYVTKYVTLYENIEDEDFVRNFARMEQWIWDGVDVAGEVYREFITDIYQDNQLINGEYCLGDDPIRLDDIEVPTQQIVGQYDNIVPPESSRPYNNLVSSGDERLIEFSAGHIGISVSGKAHDELWPDVCVWFAERDVGEDQPAAEAGTASKPDISSGGNASVDSAETTTVDAVDGIGPTYAERLAGAGIETVADLREHDPEELAEIAETSPFRTENWLESST